MGAPESLAIYLNVAGDGDSPAWLRVGTAWLQHDGSLVAHLVHLPADGRVRLQAEPISGRGRARGAGLDPTGADLAPRERRARDLRTRRREGSRGTPRR
ncbi:MAG: hypothetical protein HY825_02380 [Acidobacteria bacterium]|nr:hypothetical protein [Acidobacteriota bacterium]